MSNTMYRTIVWGQDDQLWSIASRYLLQSQYGDMSSFADDIMLANPQIVSWRLIPAGTKIFIPFLTRSGIVT